MNLRNKREFMFKTKETLIVVIDQGEAKFDALTDTFIGEVLCNTRTVCFI